ncbi:MAG: Hsp20/alpha crystallin family protein [Verrucomicrobia bacterium]|nr:Hsp20/alpha crystallin family protein [Verrucomicrobiota bacterium]MBU1733726.1 Hsp20/alpha crystallin family protein [Verrucomicrobiota bacterium]MBU1855906.1 Hsp20/alpha crystallin family protein [Verrucomicrobiota bacterium]
METNIPDTNTEPNRKSRANWILIAVIIVLCVVTFVQGVMLFGIKTERDGRLLSRAWHERLQKVLPGLADKSRQAALSPPDNQVVFWETTDDLEQIHDQINRLLRNMTPNFGATMAGGPFPGIAIQRESRNRPPAMPTSDRDLNQLQREIERIFEDAYNESRQSTLLSRFNRGWDMVPSAAAMNIEDQGSNYVVTVALPGYDKQGITISLEGRLLIIDAARTSRAQATATRNAPIARQGQFHTQIMMPDNIEGTGALATYEHDVLCVHIPKAAETNSLVRSITIR